MYRCSKKEKEEMKEKYPKLEQDDEWRNVSDREILDKYVDLEKIMSVRFRKETSY